MKLLLTSVGITNNTIANSFTNLASKNLKEIKIGFIPTAANVKLGNKDWFFRQINDLNRYEFNYIDYVDISAGDVDW